jgi:hypothetical protein
MASRARRHSIPRQTQQTTSCPAIAMRFYCPSNRLQHFIIIIIIIIIIGNRRAYCSEGSQVVPARPSGKGRLDTR